MMDFVKKTFDKIEEFRAWNAKAEMEKNRYEELKKKNDSIEAEFSERDNALIERKKSITDIERQIEDSIDRTRLKLETSIEEINEQIKLGQIEDSNLSKDIELKHREIIKLDKAIERTREEKDKADINLEDVRVKIVQMKTKEQSQDKKNKELEEDFDRVSNILRNKQEEIKDINKRQQDLELYEKRIQRYYDEAGIKIKI